MRILFVTPIIPEYRKWLYKKLGNIQNWDFYAIHGKENYGSFPKDIGLISDVKNIIIKNVYYNINSLPITWQFCFKYIYKLKPNIIILLDNVKIISNIFIFLLSKIFRYKIIFFTHGQNNGEFSKRNSQLSKIVDTFRYFILKKSDAVIAYTTGVRKRLVLKGIENKKIFVANNTLDLNKTYKFNKNVTSSHLTNLENKYNLKNKFVISFLGRLTKLKNIELFIEVITALQNRYPVAGFIIGDGPEYKMLNEQLKTNNIKDIFLIGEKFDFELACYLKKTDVVFLPQHSGLAIVHAFAFGKPFITGDSNLHGPEIEYLKNYENGLLISPPEKSNFINSIEMIITDNEFYSSLSNGALKSSVDDLSPTIMLNAFVKAIEFAISK